LNRGKVLDKARREKEVAKSTIHNKSGESEC
jgi:hypothetical protein